MSDSRGVPIICILFLGRRLISRSSTTLCLPVPTWCLYNPGLQHTKGPAWGNYDCCKNVIFIYPRFTELVFSDRVLGPNYNLESCLCGGRSPKQENKAAIQDPGHNGSSMLPLLDEFSIQSIIIIIIHWARYLFSDWPKAYGEFPKSAPVT